MADEPETTLATGTEPLGNDETARNPDGSIKNQAEATAPAAETKPAEEAKPEEKPEQKPGDGAPEQYADFKAPEGFELNKADLEKALPVFKELNLSQEQAQKLIDLQAPLAKAAEENVYSVYEKVREGWRNEVVKDPALGNGSDDLKPEVKATIAAAVNSLPNANEFRNAMVETGAGDNPAFIRAFYSLAQRLGEGNLVTGKNPSPAGQQAPGVPKSAAAAMYPNLPSSTS